MLAQVDPPRRTAANPTGTFAIRGTVRIAATDNPADMVKVQLQLLSGEPVTSTYTRYTGEFEFAGVAPGAYAVVIEMEGFEHVRESVDVRFDRNRNVQLYLSEPVKLSNTSSRAPSVSARELALSPKATAELRKGREQLFQKKDLVDSLKHFERLAREAPDFYEAHHYTGLAFSGLGKRQEAEAAWRKAIAQSNATYAPSHVALASLLCNQKRYAEAEPLARKAVQLDPDSWQGHLELARALDGQGRSDHALQSALAVRKLHGDSPELLLLLANIHLHRSDPQGLLAAYDAYLKLQPEGPTSDKIRQNRKNLLDDMARSGIKPNPAQPPSQE